MADSIFYKMIMLTYILVQVVQSQHNSESRREKVGLVGDISKEKCREYGLYVFDNPAEANSSNHDKKCIAFIEHYFLPWDNFAKPNEVPHIAAIGYEDETNQKVWKCNGALISERFVLTAAHCLNISHFGVAKYVRIGDLDLVSDNDDAKPQEFKILEKITHPNYNSTSRYNDIALIKLAKSANLNPYIRPACLETTSNIRTCEIFSSGWGHSDSGPGFSPKLRMFSSDLFSNEDCNDAYKKVVEKAVFSEILDEGQVCAGPQALSDACVLGTGRLLQTDNLDVFCTYKVMGVQSFGRGCADSKGPEVFTRVSAYIEWIEGIVWS